VGGVRKSFFVKTPWKPRERGSSSFRVGELGFAERKETERGAPEREKKVFENEEEEVEVEKKTQRTATARYISFKPSLRFFSRFLDAQELDRRDVVSTLSSIIGISSISSISASHFRIEKGSGGCNDSDEESS